MTVVNLNNSAPIKVFGDIGGGESAGGVALINVTTDGQVKRLGKSYNEIVALIENGTLPVAVDTNSGATSIMPCYLATPGEEVGGEVYPYQVNFLNYSGMEKEKIFSADTATAELTSGNTQ